MHSFLCTSTVLVRWGKAQEIRGLKRIEIGNVSDTRWACQAKQLSAMAKRIEVVHEVLEEIIDNDTDADRVVDANGFKLHMDCCFFAISFNYQAYYEDSEICLRYVAETNQ